MAPFNNAPETGTRDARTTGRGAGAGALVGGALFVSVIALCALVIAYNGIYEFAAVVHDDGSFLAHVFPVTFALLVLMAFWVSYVLRAAPPKERLWVDVVLIPLLIITAAVPMVLNSLELIDRLAETNERLIQVVVAVAPLAALLVAFLLWITVRAHIRKRNAAAHPRPRPSDDRTTVLRNRPESLADEAPVEEDSEPEELKTRLLRLGADHTDHDDRPEAEREDDEDTLTEAPPLPTRTSTLRRDRAEQEAKDRAEQESRDRAERAEAEAKRAEEEEEEEEAETRGEPQVDPEAPTVPVPAAASPDTGTGTAKDAAAEEGKESEGSEDLDEPSVPTLPLPRRARSGDNPIKRAAAEVPVVPAAVPAPESETDPESELEPERIVVIPEHLADEGFEHDGPVGDPSSDEAEAPVPPVAAEPEPEPSTVVAPEPEPSTELESSAVTDPDPLPDVEELPILESADSAPEPEATEPESEPVGAAESEAGSTAEAAEPAATEPAPDAADTAPLWEPPADDGGASPLDDYVPPVWTPPDEDGTPAERTESDERAESGGFAESDGAAESDESTESAGTVRGHLRSASEPTPALDHDTGPEVRAAFRLGSVPPDPARPEPESDPLPEAEELPAQDSGDTAESAETGETAETTESKKAPEPEDAAPEPETEPAPEPKAPTKPKEPVKKRPMVLKPKRPPLPDFASGPPSRRVRSEPLPPEER